ncbi:MAG: energy transducer TonB [Gemmatimonadota bacterium]
MLRAGRWNRAARTVEAWVSVTVWVDEGGSVEWAEVSESSGRESLDEIALTLFEDVAEFMPAREGDERIPQTMIFQISFPWSR